MVLVAWRLLRARTRGVAWLWHTPLIGEERSVPPPRSLLRGTYGEVIVSAMEAQQSSGPNPLCEVGRTHPRDRHRMKPLADHSGVWECARHELFATIVPEDVAESLDRGDPYTMHDGRPGVVVRQGDERGGGVIFYYRAEA